MFRMINFDDFEDSCHEHDVVIVVYRRVYATYRIF